MNYLDFSWLARCVYLSSLCPESESAFSVGAIIVDQKNNFLSSGYSRELGDKEHAEECAITKLPHNINTSMKIYTSMVPCSNRASKELSCIHLLHQHGIKEINYLLDEPNNFVKNCSNEIAHQLGLSLVTVAESEQKKRLAELAFKYCYPTKNYR